MSQQYPSTSSSTAASPCYSIGKEGARLGPVPIHNNKYYLHDMERQIRIFKHTGCIWHRFRASLVPEIQALDNIFDRLEYLCAENHDICRRVWADRERLDAKLDKMARFEERVFAVLDRRLVVLSIPIARARARAEKGKRDYSSATAVANEEDEGEAEAADSAAAQAEETLFDDWEEIFKDDISDSVLNEKDVKGKAPVRANMD